MAKERVVMVKENRKIRLKSEPIVGECLFNEKILRAWYMLRLFYTGIRGRLRLVLDERYALPLTPYLDIKYTPEDVISRTDRDHHIDTATNLYQSKAKKDNIKNMTNYTILIIVSVVGMVFLLIALLLASKTCTIGG